MTHERGTILILIACCVTVCVLKEADAAPVTSDIDAKFKVTSLMTTPEELVGPSSQVRSKRYVLHGGKWPRKDLTYKIVRTTQKYNTPLVDEEIARAFAVWSKYTDLSFTRKLSGEADIEITFSPVYDGPVGSVSYSTFPCGGGDVWFDEVEDWSISGRGDSQFFGVAVHEIGHALGIDHSNVPTSVMLYAIYDPEVGLDSDDIDAIQELYGPISPELARSR